MNDLEEEQLDTQRRQGILSILYEDSPTFENRRRVSIAASCCQNLKPAYRPIPDCPAMSVKSVPSSNAHGRVIIATLIVKKQGTTV